MERYIIWLTPINRKILYRSFYTEAKNVNEALENLKTNADFEYRVIGISGYNNLGASTQDERDKAFKNNYFH